MASRAHTTGKIVWSHNRGRNGWDVPSDISPDMSAESMNIDIERGTVGKKRRGAADQALSGTFTGFNALFKFIPGQDDTAAEIIFVDLDATPKIMRVAAGTGATSLTLKDNIASNPHLVRAAVLNGKLFLAYDSSVNRLHVFDPSLSTTTVRRAGLATPGAPTVADQGSGTYATALRYYKVEWQVRDGSGNILRRSLLGTISASFTPSTTGASARVTIPSVASEGETHWIIYGSQDGVSFYQLAAAIAIGTTTYDDSADPADYEDTADAAGYETPDTGAFTPFPSVKTLLSTGDRLLGYGVWETSAGDSMTPKAGRVFFTPVLDTTDSQDDERISNTVEFQGWIDVGRNMGGEDRALAGPMDSMIFVFQSRGIWSLVPAGRADSPFRRIPLRDDIGALSQESTFMGEDEDGKACIYFLDPIRGPYRYGARSFQWLGYDVQDIWATVNLAATTRVAAGVWHPGQRACIFGIATGSANVITEFIKFFPREAHRASTESEEVRGGWVRNAGPDAWTYRCMAVLPETLGATMSRTLKPYAGHSTELHRFDDASATQDDSVNFQAYATSPAFVPANINQRLRIQKAYMQASAHNGVTLTLSLIKNFGADTRTDTELLTASGSETRVMRQFDNAQDAEVKAMQFKIGEAAAANNALWTVDEIIAPFETVDED